MKRGPYACGPSCMDLAILRTIEHEPCAGEGRLMAAINVRGWTYIRSRLARLQRSGLVDLVPPPMHGRGYKMIIRKRG